jgi:hypothetical protein
MGEVNVCPIGVHHFLLPQASTQKKLEPEPLLLIAYRE